MLLFLFVFKSSLIIFSIKFEDITAFVVVILETPSRFLILYILLSYSQFGIYRPFPAYTKHATTYIIDKITILAKN
ncbi:hypothetical protein PIPA1_26480 [Pelosinus sp. IPA-1]|nr:hypothetical protein PIPA1_26480 [Pelosinus sp. IPA-1]